MREWVDASSLSGRVGATSYRIKINKDSIRCSCARQHTSFLRNGLRLLAFVSFAFAASQSNLLGEGGKSGRVDIAASSFSVCFAASIVPFFEREPANQATFKPDAVGNLLLCIVLTAHHLTESNATYFFPPV